MHFVWQELTNKDNVATAQKLNLVSTSPRKIIIIQKLNHKYPCICISVYHTEYSVKSCILEFSVKHDKIGIYFYIQMQNIPKVILKDSVI